MAYSPCCAQAYLTTWNRFVGVWIALATEPFPTALYRQMDSWTPPVHQQNGFFSAPFTRSTLCAANAQFWTKALGNLGSAPLHYERIPRKQRQRIHCKQSQRVSSAFAALVHRSRCLFSAGGCDSAGSSLRSSVSLPLYVN